MPSTLISLRWTALLSGGPPNASFSLADAVSTSVWRFQRASALPNGTYELRTDYTIIRYPNRYTDKRGAKIWTEVMDLVLKCRSQPATATDAA
jgi:hypothetical protein